MKSWKEVFETVIFEGSVVLNTKSIKRELLFPKSYQKSFPQIIFAGMSNAGKSSLINALLSSDIVKTSRKPGHTKTINLFNVSDKFYLTDIPGYGLNSKDEWGEMMMKYFSYHKPQIKRVFVLKDVLHRLRAEDQRMVMLLEQEKMPYQIIMTKKDLFPEELLPLLDKKVKKNLEDFVQQNSSCCSKKILMTSAKTKEGISELRKELCDILGIKVHK